MTNEEVKKIQKALYDQGWFDHVKNRKGVSYRGNEALAVDGIYGSGTDAAMKAARAAGYNWNGSEFTKGGKQKQVWYKSGKTDAGGWEHLTDGRKRKKINSGEYFYMSDKNDTDDKPTKTINRDKAAAEELNKKVLVAKEQQKQDAAFRKKATEENNKADIINTYDSKTESPWIDRNEWNTHEGGISIPIRDDYMPAEKDAIRALNGINLEEWGLTPEEADRLAKLTLSTMNKESRFGKGLSYLIRDILPDFAIELKTGRQPSRGYASVKDANFESPVYNNDKSIKEQSVDYNNRNYDDLLYLNRTKLASDLAKKGINWEDREHSPEVSALIALQMYTNALKRNPNLTDEELYYKTWGGKKSPVLLEGIEKYDQGVTPTKGGVDKVLGYIANGYDYARQGITRGRQKLVSKISDAFPTNVGMLINDIAGDTNRVYTENDFSPEQLALTRQVIQNALAAGRTTIDEQDWGAANDASGNYTGKGGMFSPQTSMMTAIGGAKISEDENNYYLEDIYNWNNARRLPNLVESIEDNDYLYNPDEKAKSALYLTARSFADQYGSVGGNGSKLGAKTRIAIPKNIKGNKLIPKGQFGWISNLYDWMFESVDPVEKTVKGQESNKKKLISKPNSEIKVHTTDRANGGYASKPVRDATINGTPAKGCAEVSNFQANKTDKYESYGDAWTRGGKTIYNGYEHAVHPDSLFADKEKFYRNYDYDAADSAAVHIDLNKLNPQEMYGVNMYFANSPNKQKAGNENTNNQYGTHTGNLYFDKNKNKWIVSHAIGTGENGAEQIYEDDAEKILGSNYLYGITGLFNLPKKTLVAKNK